MACTRRTCFSLVPLARPTRAHTPPRAGAPRPLPPRGLAVDQVLAVGDEVDLPIKAGDMILFQKYAMAEVEVKEGQILFVAQKSVVAKLE